MASSELRCKAKPHLMFPIPNGARLEKSPRFSNTCPRRSVVRRTGYHGIKKTEKWPGSQILEIYKEEIYRLPLEESLETSCPGL